MVGNILFKFRFFSFFRLGLRRIFEDIVLIFFIVFFRFSRTFGGK